MPSREKKLVKVVIELEPTDWHSYGAETLWAEALRHNKYRLINTPIAAYGYSLDDIVCAKEEDERLVVTSVWARGGHSTYRLLLDQAASLEDPLFLRYWRPLKENGCTYESDGKKIVAIDVPPETDIYAVYDLLRDGEEAQAWSFEEAHVGHPLRR